MVLRISKIELRISDLDFAIRISQSEIALPLRELEALARALLPVLLSLLNSRIACHQPGLLQRRTKIPIEFNQRPCDPMPNSARLTRWATARNVDQNVKLVCRIRQLQRLANNHAQCFVGKVLRKRFPINNYLTSARSQINSRGRGLAPSRTVVLNLSHCLSCPLIFSVFNFDLKERLVRRVAGVGLGGDVRHRRKSSVSLPLLCPAYSSATCLLPPARSLAPGVFGTSR